MERNESDRPPTAGSGSGAAAAVEGVGWGLFFIWVGICFLADLGWGVFLLGTGGLMLAAQAARSHYALKLDRFGLLLGGGFAVAGLMRVLGLKWNWSTVPHWIVPVLSIALGMAIVVSAWRRGRRP